MKSGWDCVDAGHGTKQTHERLGIAAAIAALPHALLPKPVMDGTSWTMLLATVRVEQGASHALRDAA